MIDYKYADLFYEDSIDKQLKIEVEDGTEFTNEDILMESMSLDESICSETSLKFGCCEASEFKITVANRFSPLIGMWLDVSEVLDGNEDDPFVFGRYKVESDEPTADRVYREITAYDAMYDILNADMSEVADWYNEIFPYDYSTVTLKTFRTSFINHFGIEEESITLPNDSMIVGKTISAAELSAKTVLNAICEINGCFGHIGRDGKFQYIMLNTISEDDNSSILGDMILGKAKLGSVEPGEFAGNIYRNCTYEDYECQRIDAVHIQETEGDAGGTAGEGENIYNITGNFLVYGKEQDDLDNIANNILLKVSNLLYRPAQITATGNPCVVVGDSISLDTKYQRVNTYVLKRTLSGIQALVDTYEADGTEIYIENGTSLESIIDQLQGKSNVLTRDIDSTKSELVDVAERLSSEIVQTADSLTIEISKVQDEVYNLGKETITGETIEYYSSYSPTQLIGGSWSEDAPEWEEDKYIWVRTIVRLGDGSETITEPICISGSSGKDGIGIESIVAYYATSTNNVYYPTHGGDTVSILGEMVLGIVVLGNTGTWTVYVPEMTDEDYLWLSFLITYTDGSSSWTEPCCLTDKTIKDQISQLNEKYATFEVTVNGINASIETLQGEVNLYYENTEEQISEISVDLNSITASVSNIKTDLDENYLTTEEVLAELTVESNQIMTRVSETYATQENVNYIAGIVDKLQEDAVATVETYYAVSSSNADPGEVTWQTDKPDIGEGQFLWVRYLITYINGKTEWTDPICVTSDADLAIVSIVPYYSLSEDPNFYQPHDAENTAFVDYAIVGSALVGVDGLWTTNQPEPNEYEYMWVSYLITLASGDTFWTEPTRLNDKTTKDAILNLQEQYSEIVQTIDSISLSVVGSLGGTASITLTVGEEAITGDIDLSKVREAFAEEDSSIIISAGTILFESNTFLVDSYNLIIEADGSLTCSNGTFYGSMMSISGDYEAGVTGGRFTIYYGDSEMGHIRSNYYSSSENRGFTINLINAVYSGFSIDGSLYYILNNGLNPNSVTQRHIFHGGILSYSGITVDSYVDVVNSSGIYFHESGASSRTRGLYWNYSSDYNGLYLVISDDLYMYSLYNNRLNMGRQDGGSSFTLNVLGTLHATYTSFSLSTNEVQTENYNTVSLYSTNATTPIFEDIGSGTIADDGKIDIYFDPEFAETIDLTSEYYVILTRTSEKDVYYVKKDFMYFTVYGEAGATFDWELVAYRQEYAATRLEHAEHELGSEDENDVQEVV